MNKIAAKIVPFFFVGTLLVILVVGFILLSYLLIWGAAVGLVLFAVAWLREKLTSKPHLPSTHTQKSNRTIDHDHL